MNAPRFVIVGGGVIGLSAAYHLARSGAGRVILLEQGAVGAGSSSRAGGIITGHLWSQTGVAARKISLRLFHELSEELGAYGLSGGGLSESVFAGGLGRAEAIISTV